jgi:hypothetical protein
MAGALIGFLRNTFAKGDPLRIVANHTQQNRIANILMDLSGVGCRVVKPINADGKGWKIVVDGGTDTDEPAESFVGFNGKCYAPNGIITEGLTDAAKPWLEFNEQNWTFAEIVGPVATPWAAYRQYRLKTDVRGAWYATVNG